MLAEIKISYDTNEVRSVQKEKKLPFSEQEGRIDGFSNYSTKAKNEIKRIYLVGLDEEGILHQSYAIKKFKKDAPTYKARTLEAMLLLNGEGGMLVITPYGDIPFGQYFQVHFTEQSVEEYIEKWEKQTEMKLHIIEEISLTL